MNVGSAFATAVLQVIFAILSIIKWLVIIAAVISWVSPDPRNPIVQFLYRTTFSRRRERAESTCPRSS